MFMLAEFLHTVRITVRQDTLGAGSFWEARRPPLPGWVPSSTVRVTRAGADDDEADRAAGTRA
jgi:hypothetical protein